MAYFFKNEGQQALAATIASLEEVSSAEVVVAVRPSSAHYLHLDLAIGSIAALAALAILVYGPWPVAYHVLLLDPVLVGLLVGFASSRLVPVQRGLCRLKTRRLNVTRAAKAEFVDRGIHNTRERSGVLVYVSLHERTLAVVADAGIRLAMAADAWEQACARLRDSVESGGDAVALAKELQTMSRLLATHLPRRDDDIDELSNEVVQ